MPFETHFFVPGHPITKGNLHPMINRKTGRAFVVEDVRGTRGKKYKAWMSAVANEGRKYQPPSPLECAFRIDLTFQFVRPKSSKRPYATGIADKDKLERAVLDALHLVDKWGCAMFKDDNLAVDGRTQKRWGDTEGVWIFIESLEGEQENLL